MAWSLSACPRTSSRGARQLPIQRRTGRFGCCSSAGQSRKGLDALLDAIELLAPEAERGQIPDFELRLAGIEAASLPAGLSPAARRRITPLGSLTPDALSAEYAGAHAVTAPSRYESFGLVYQEGIAFGRPMIASNEDASARAFVGAVGAGSMAAETTGPALAAALRPVLCDPAYRSLLREKALLAAGRFSRETLGEETLALYRAAIARFQAV
jgi:glycogen(starch) synthase